MAPASTPIAAALLGRALHREAPVLPFEVDVRGSNTEAECGVRQPGLEDAGVRERERRADCRVAGERRFRGAREDPDAMVGARLLGRKYESALRQIRFSRERLHRVGVETCRLHEHEELIPLQPPIGEDVEVDVSVRPLRL